MAKNNIKTSVGYTESEHRENRQLYQKMQDSKVVHVRMNKEERCLLESMMKEKGYTVTSNFIKHHLFGFDPKAEVVKTISEQDMDMSVRILRELMLEVSEKYTYVLTRYNKDMTILHHTEGSDVNKWIKATERWHEYLIRSMDDMFWYINLIAEEFGLKEKWAQGIVAPPQLDGEMSPEDIMRESERQRIERIANGRGTKD